MKYQKKIQTPRLGLVRNHGRLVDGIRAGYDVIEKVCAIFYLFIYGRPKTN